jgi:hypothetical protein
VFLVGVPIAILMLVASLFLKQLPLRSSSGLARPSEDLAMSMGEVGSADAELDGTGPTDASGDGALGQGVPIA